MLGISHRLQSAQIESYLVQMLLIKQRKAQALLYSSFSYQ